VSVDSTLLPKDYMGRLNTRVMTRICGRTIQECPTYDPTICDNCIGNRAEYGNDVR